MGLQISTEYWILWILDIRTSLRFKKCHSEYASNILKSAICSTLDTIIIYSSFFTCIVLCLGIAIIDNIDNN